MKIVVVGMFRAGSTVLFNMIRYMLIEEYGKDEVYSCYYPKRNPKKEKKYVVMKQHDFDAGLLEESDMVFTTRRDIRDVVASLIRRDGRHRWKSIPKVCQWAKDCYDGWKKHSTYEFVYERYKANPLKVIKEVGAILNIDCKARKIQEKLEALKKPRQPRETLIMSAKHVTDGSVHSFAKTLDEKEIKIIEEMANDLLYRKQPC